MSDSYQRWTVLDWHSVDGGILGCTIVCVECNGAGGVVWPRCRVCDGDGTLHQPYRLPNGCPIDLAGPHAELYIQIECPAAPPTADYPEEEQ